MRMTWSISRVVPGVAAVVTGVLVWAQGTGMLPRDHPAIQYSTAVTRDAITALNGRVSSGQQKLVFEESPLGYLRSVLEALDVSPTSQTLVFSENSLQGKYITKESPRALYFNDAVSVSWVKGGESIEVTVLDPSQGVHFYSIPQQSNAMPQFERRTNCLQCHLMPQTYGVPGVFTMSQLPLSDNKNDYAQGWGVNHSTPIEDRWGGWYVTGAQVPLRHLGNVPVSHVPVSYVRAEVAPKLKTGAEAFDASAYLTPHSDVVALLVLNHQLHMTNLLIHLGWEARVAAHKAQGKTTLPEDIQDSVASLVDYMLFVDEAPLPAKVEGLSGFQDYFESKGLRDAKGRSLRQFDLSRRMMRYPCSYMIYSDAFDALPEAAKSAVYARLWSVLSGKEKDKTYAKLSLADRRAIVDILVETKKGLPEYFRPFPVSPRGKSSRASASR